MAWSVRKVDRRVSWVIYLTLCVMVLWAGSGLINYCLEYKFYRKYLLAWESAGIRLANKEVNWPRFDGTNHDQYMREIVNKMEAYGIMPPLSNTNLPYTYTLERLWGKKEKVFILLFPDKMIVYGLSRRTFEKIDRYVDGCVDFKTGKVEGKQGKDESTIICIWRI